MKNKSIFLLIFVSMTVTSLVCVPVMASIPAWGEDEDYGEHQSWAWAWLYAEYDPHTGTYHNIQHNWDWAVWGPYYYWIWELYSDDVDHPATRTVIFYSTDGINYYPDADAYVQF
jgi:hypothetical protein